MSAPARCEVQLNEVQRTPKGIGERPKVGRNLSNRTDLASKCTQTLSADGVLRQYEHECLQELGCTVLGNFEVSFSGEIKVGIVVFWGLQSQEPSDLQR